MTDHSAMTTEKYSVTGGRRKRAKTETSCIEIFNCYANTDPAELSVINRMKAIATMKGDLITTALLRGNATASMPDNNACLDTFNAAPYAAEIKILNRFVAENRYSDSLHRWIGDRRRDFVRRIRSLSTSGKLQRQWLDAQQPEDQLSMIENIMSIQADVYSAGAISFTPPAVRFVDKNLEHIYLGKIEASYPDIEQGRLPDVELSMTLFLEAEPRHALEIGHHEQIHRLLTELAAAAISGKLKKSHPFYADAHMKVKKLEAGAVIDCALDEPYLRQPEEQLCRAQQSLFIREFMPD